MKILYSPQINVEDILTYEFIGDKIIVNYNGETDEFDFTNMSDGFAINNGRRTDITSTLPISPIYKAHRENGVLMVHLLKFIGEDASENERFPEWIEVG